MKLIGVLLGLALPAAAHAQAPPPTGVVNEPIGRFAVDVQGSLANFPQDASIASSLGTIEENLPGRGLGGRLAATFYPFRLGPVTIGIGGALAFARGSDQGEFGQKVTTTFVAGSPQLSLNFGRARGWSYLSGGITSGRLTIALEGAGNGPSARTLDYGGGARWFTNNHVAFSFDFRFYKIDATEAASGIAARGSTTMTVISAGISLK